MRTQADLESSRVKRLALKGKTKTKLKKFVKAILDDLNILKSDIGAFKRGFINGN